jgi:hypothetical protein
VFLAQLVNQFLKSLPEPLILNNHTAASTLGLPARMVDQRQAT